MSDELEELGVTPEQIAEAKAAEQEPEPDPEPKPEPKPESTGYDLVDFNELPEEVRDKFQARFNRIYRQMKTQDTTLDQMSQDHRAVLAEQKRLREELSAERRGKEIATIRNQIKAASEEGDFDKVADLQVYLAEKNAEKHVVKPEPQPKPVQEALTEDEVIIKRWAEDVKPDGSPKRPWAMAGDPRQARAIQLTGEVFENPQYAHLSTFDKLAMVDKKMAGPVKPASSTVLSGDSNVRPEAKKTELTKEQMAVARRTYPDMKPADAYKEYQAGMADTGVYQ